MKENLEKEIKAEMGYTELVKECEKCHWFKEVDNPHLDRDWIATCTFNNIGSMVVSHSAHCNHWKAKK